MLRQHVERGRGQILPQQLAQLTSWLLEQEEELAALRAHCQDRWDQLDSTLSTLNRLGLSKAREPLTVKMPSWPRHGTCFLSLAFYSLQVEHDRFRDWLQAREHQAADGGRLDDLLKDVHDQR